MAARSQLQAAERPAAQGSEAAASAASSQLSRSRDPARISHLYAEVPGETEAERPQGQPGTHQELEAEEAAVQDAQGYQVPRRLTVVPGQKPSGASKAAGSPPTLRRPTMPAPKAPPPARTATVDSATSADGSSNRSGHDYEEVLGASETDSASAPVDDRLRQAAKTAAALVSKASQQPAAPVQQHASVASAPYATFRGIPNAVQPAPATEESGDDASTQSQPEKPTGVAEPTSHTQPEDDAAAPQEIAASNAQRLTSTTAVPADVRVYEALWPEDVPTLSEDEEEQEGTVPHFAAPHLTVTELDDADAGTNGDRAAEQAATVPVRRFLLLHYTLEWLINKQTDSCLLLLPIGPG